MSDVKGESEQVVEHKTLLQELRKIAELELEVEARKTRLLHQSGWDRSSAYADCYWRWSKTIEGRVITTTDMDEALRLEERISPCDEDCNHDD